VIAIGARKLAFRHISTPLLTSSGVPFALVQDVQVVVWQPTTLKALLAVGKGLPMTPG